MCGFLGIALGLFIYISILCNIKSFGVYFISPYSSSRSSKGNNYFLPPIRKRDYRAPYVSPIKAKQQDAIAMKWRFFPKQYR